MERRKHSLKGEKTMSMSCFDCHDYMDGFNRGKREGTIEELEQIKKKIHKLAFDDNDGEYIGVIDNDDVMDLIDKRISELKGEKK